MAFGSPESAGIPRLAHIVFTVKGNPQQNSHKKSEFHPSSRSRTTAAFVPRCLHSPYIFYGNSTEPDPQLYHVILSCQSAIAITSWAPDVVNLVRPISLQQLACYGECTFTEKSTIHARNLLAQHLLLTVPGFPRSM